MLRTETVERTTLELLKTLMLDEKLEHFSLVGGTALALYMGHRNSEDLVLFSHRKFDVNALEKHLQKTYGFIKLHPEQFSVLLLIGDIKNVKVDCVFDDGLQVEPVYHYGSVRIASIYDIAAMKLKAILQNGERLKDFVDVAYLSTKMPFNKMLHVFDAKYPSTSSLLAIKALSYFNDIDFSTQIQLTEGEFKWEKIKERLEEMINKPNKVFFNNPIEIDSGFKPRVGIRK
jgi:hypothetical protein